MNLKYRKLNLILNNDEMSGNTFPARDFIKGKLSGKWNADSKTWTVDLEAVNYWVEKGAMTIDSAPAPAPVVAQTAAARPQRDGFIVRNGMDGWCNKCHSYCYGDCDS